MATVSFLNTSHQTINWFAEQNRLGRLTVKPPFQRRPVWTPEESAYLVDTILRGYPIPEIYIYMSPDADGGDHVYVVDGQQRLRACLEFLADGYAIKFDPRKLGQIYSLADTPWYNKRFSELSVEQKEAFRRYKLIVRDLEGVTDDHIRHMFHRLNQSTMSLNAQELRYSMYRGGLLATVERLVEREEWDTFRIFTKLQRRRMLDSEYVAELVIGYLHWPQNKKDNLDDYYRQYGPEFPFADQVTERFDFVLDYLARLFPEPRMAGTRWYRKSDFYTLFLAIARGRINVATMDSGKFRESLVDFSNRVGDSKVSEEPDSPVMVYRAAVERAATDRARRVRREDALASFVAGLLSVPAAGAEYLTAEESDSPSADQDEEDEEYLDE
ncbi:DUF262 domain-containing protein [Actinoplanes sp. TBRC 11911]|uniref:GmrSD restriction endonuclease domain-containing protein n=1 Tax=Actinoplanes sp. TBRC 11911 TaxID=2729386 RepID=UPI00145C4B48|nr:DUF262 domain-containing protein [Actinoplanes sp. TBRC 11911]NMO57519.1 DUF262 domain-containing protein [Actinoplanes sp. TBRC 11911]